MARNSKIKRPPVNKLSPLQVDSFRPLPKVESFELQEDTFIVRIDGQEIMMPWKKRKMVVHPRIVFDLARIHCTYDEIAQVTGCDIDVLEHNYQDIIRIGNAHGKMSLRRAMFRNAVDLQDASMQRYLGSNYLRMQEATEERQKKEAQSEKVEALVGALVQMIGVNNDPKPSLPIDVTHPPHHPQTPQDSSGYPRQSSSTPKP